MARATKRGAGKRVGRPSSLTPAVQARIVQAVETGATIEVACRAAGIGKTTFHRWMASDAPEFRAFREAVEKAEAAGEIAAIGVIRTAALDTWQAAAWFLERKHHARWGRKAEIQPVDDRAKPTDADARDALARKLDRLAAEVGSGGAAGATDAGGSEGSAAPVAAVGASEPTPA
jgi:hypothetical protein